MSPSDIVPTIDKGKSDGLAVAFDTYNQSIGPVTHALRNPNGTYGDALPAIHSGMAVRRLTPRECERLQGFPNDYTLIPVGKRGKFAADGPRYKAIGNSMAVPCMSWLGGRIQTVDNLTP
jgi:DNA (cytosine-5)-methyltransferase 1